MKTHFLRTCREGSFANVSEVETLGFVDVERTRHRRRQRNRQAIFPALPSVAEGSPVRVRIGVILRSSLQATTNCPVRAQPAAAAPQRIDTIWADAWTSIRRDAAASLSLGSTKPHGFGLPKDGAYEPSRPERRRCHRWRRERAGIRRAERTTLTAEGSSGQAVSTPTVGQKQWRSSAFRRRRLTGVRPPLEEQRVKPRLKHSERQPGDVLIVTASSRRRVPDWTCHVGVGGWSIGSKQHGPGGIAVRLSQRERRLWRRVSGLRGR